LFKKICKECKKIIEYNDPKELLPYFYFKCGYFINTCKECELKKHAKKYKEGTYNYHQHKNDGYFENYSIGNFSRCG